MRKKIIIIVLTFLLLISGMIFLKNKQNHTYIAKVDRFSISDRDYIQKLNVLINRMGLPDNGEVRRGLLRNLVEEKVFFVDGIRRGFDRDSLAQFKKNFIERKVLLNMLLDTIVRQKVSVTDSELIEIFKRANMKVRAKYLLARTKEEADSLENLLRQGASWDELAKQIFHDSHLKATGGDLGYFTLDEMELPIEDAAYSLPLNKISQPIPFSKGYAILKVIDRKGNLFLTETEFAKNKEKLARFLIHRKKKIVLDAYVDSLIQTLHIRYNDKNLQFIYHLFEQYKNIEEVQEFAKAIPDRLLDKELLTYDGQIFTVQNYLQEVRFNETFYSRWIDNYDDFKQFLNGMVARKYLMQSPQAKRIQKSEKYHNRVRENFENFVVDRTLEFYKSNISIPQDTLMVYYEKNKDLFAEPDLYKFYSLELLDRNLKQQILRYIQKGYTLEKISRLTEHHKIKGGEAGYLTIHEFRKYLKRKDIPSVGKVYGPYAFRDKLAFFQCIEKLEGKAHAFEEVLPQVKKAVLYAKWDNYRKQIADSLKHTMFMDVKYSKLRKLNRRLKENG